MKSAQLSILFLISISRCIDDYLKLCHGHPYFRDRYSVTSIPSTTIWFVLSRRLTLGRDKLTYYCTMGGIPLFVLVPTYVRTCTNLQWAESSFLWSKHRQRQETCHKVCPHTVNWFLHSDIPFDQLRYESSTLILYKELSSPIFQSCEWVHPSGIGNTCPDLYFVQYIKA